MGLQVHTFFTPSHQILFDDWLNYSAKTHGIQIYPFLNFDQLCTTGSFGDDGWRATQLKKVENYISIFENNNDSEIIVGTDADVQFIRPCENQLIEFLGNYDISFQENVGGKICSGFFVARCNSNVIDFFKKVSNSLKNEISKSSEGGGEQYEMWKLIESGNHSANIGMLPKNEIWNPRTKYTELSELVIPDNMLVHHANWTHGLDNKIKQLAYVRERLSEM